MKHSAFKMREMCFFAIGLQAILYIIFCYFFYDVLHGKKKKLQKTTQHLGKRFKLQNSTTRQGNGLLKKESQ